MDVLATPATTPADVRGHVWVVTFEAIPALRETAAVFTDESAAWAFADWLHGDDHEPIQSLLEGALLNPTPAAIEALRAERRAEREPDECVDCWPGCGGECGYDVPANADRPPGTSGSWGEA